MNLLVVKSSTFSKWAYLLAYYCNLWECLIQKVGKPELVLSTTCSYSYGQELVPCGHSSYHNFMNSWLGKPSSGFPTSWKRYILILLLHKILKISSFLGTIDCVSSMCPLTWSQLYESVWTSSGTYNYWKLKTIMGPLSSNWVVVPGGLMVMTQWRHAISSHPWWAR